MNGRLLHNRATLAGTIAAAAAGALTVGLVSGVTHIASAQSGTTTTTGNSTSGSSSAATTSGEHEGGDDSRSSNGSNSTSGGSVNTAPQNSRPQGGSHGS